MSQSQHYQAEFSLRKRLVCREGGFSRGAVCVEEGGGTTPGHFQSNRWLNPRMWCGLRYAVLGITRTLPYAEDL